MAEFPGKLAIFRQKAASLREAARGGSPENLKTQGGVFWKFSISGGVFWLYPPPCRPLVLRAFIYFAICQKARLFIKVIVMSGKTTKINISENLSSVQYVKYTRNASNSVIEFVFLIPNKKYLQFVAKVSWQM